MRLEAGEAIKEDEEAAAVAMVGFDGLFHPIFPTGGQEVDGET